MPRSKRKAMKRELLECGWIKVRDEVEAKPIRAPSGIGGSES